MHLGDRTDAGDHPGGGERQLGRLPEQGLAVGDGEQVGAELVDLGEQAGLRGGGEPEHGDDRGDADGDPERRQRRPDPARAQADARDAREVGETQPWRLDAQGRGRAHGRGWFTSANAARCEVPFTTAVTM